MCEIKQCTGTVRIKKNAGFATQKKSMGHAGLDINIILRTSYTRLKPRTRYSLVLEILAEIGSSVEWYND